MSQPPRDNRFITVRAAAQDATEFSLPDETIERFLALRDGGTDAAGIAAELGLVPGLVDQLIAADESYAVAHRIATGQEPMYPVPGPTDRVVDARAGSSVVPIVVLIGILVLVIAYALLR